MSFLTGTNTELIYVNSASGTAKNTFTSEFQINDTAGMGAQAALPAYFWQPKATSVGVTIRIVARGILSTTSAPTWQYVVRLGAAGTTAPIILESNAITGGTTVTNQMWELEGDVTMRTLGAAGGNSTVQGLGLVTGPNAFASPFGSQLFANNASPGTVATVDISIVNYISFNVICGTSSSSNSIQLLQLEVWGLN